MIWSEFVSILCSHSYKMEGESDYQIYSSSLGHIKLLLDWAGAINEWKVSLLIDNDLKDTWFLSDTRLVPISIPEDSKALVMFRKDGQGYILSDHLESSY